MMIQASNVLFKVLTIAARPASAFYQGKEIADDPVILLRFFDVDRMTRIWNHRERSRRNALLQEDALQKARPILVPGDDQRRNE